MTDESLTRVRLLIAEDHALVREGMKAMLAGEPDITVVGAAANGREAVELCSSLSPDLVLMDVRMPEMDGLEATRAIKDTQPTVSVLMVTTHREPDYLLEAVKAGAAGYILKEASRSELLESIRRVLGGEPILDQGVTMKLLSRLSENSVRHTERVSSENPQATAPEETPTLLSDREVDVLRLIAVGRTNREIARDLLVSLSTVKTCVQRIIRKLGVSDRTQAAVRASELGLYPKT